MRKEAARRHQRGEKGWRSAHTSPQPASAQKDVAAGNDGGGGGDGDGAPTATSPRLSSVANRVVLSACPMPWLPHHEQVSIDH